MRTVLFFIAMCLAISAFITAPAPQAATADLAEPEVDRLGDLAVHATHYVTDPSCTFVRVSITDGDRERTVRVPLDEVMRNRGWSGVGED